MLVWIVSVVNLSVPVVGTSVVGRVDRWGGPRGPRAGKIPKKGKNWGIRGPMVGHLWVLLVAIT